MQEENGANTFLWPFYVQEDKIQLNFNVVKLFNSLLLSTVWIHEMTICSSHKLT